jgi:amino acid adenylation domain-containing protein
MPIQYADFVLWQSEWLQSVAFDSQVSYWRNRLTGSETLNLPIDYSRPAVASSDGARQRLTFAPELTERLKALSRQQGVTLFMTLLAAFQTLLQRYTTQDDIVVGSPIAGRNYQETEGLLGFFVNMIVLRTDLSNNPTFTELLKRVRQISLEAYERQDLPFERLVQELNPDRSLSQNPLFQTVFSLQSHQDSELKLPSLSAKRLEIVSRTTKFDLGLSVTEVAGSLSASFSYKSSLFSAETIERWLRHYEALLHEIVANPERPIAHLIILTEREKHQLLIEWNDTGREYPSDKSIHRLFEEQVERTPEATAVVFEDRQLSYRELNRRSNQLARYLKRLGVGPDVPVGICMERSEEMIVAMIGVLKAGGAYVPLDPSYPKERLAFMLQDCDAPVLISQHEFLSSFTDCRAKIISLDRDWKRIDQEHQGNLIEENSADPLAYVIYTSGSTGQPKGVAVSHRAVNRLVINTDYVELTSAHVIAQAANVSFDAATFEIWGALLNGARLVLIAKDTLLSPRALSTAIERHGITTLFLTTALFNQMVAQIPAALGKLSHLLFGGEAVDAQRVRELLGKGAPKRLLHVYGPTETTTFASSYWVKSVVADVTTVPIGRPIANTDIYILDAHLNPVPIGVTAELYIGGPGVARGYLNRPELTAAKFVADPFSNEPQARLYRTGDLARYLPDGNIEFVGRIDNQVKIRGFRVELSEIEAVLNQQPMVCECVVLARECGPGEKRLVAYIVAAPRAATAAEPLRLSLHERLPEYMVPATFVFIAALPLTPNGKVDRKALPEPESIRRNVDDRYVAPRTAAEKLLAEIWAEILKADRVGVDDNFFELGGHSLVAVRLVAEMEKRLGCNVPVALLFQLPTIAQLASELHPRAPEQASPVIAVQPKGSMPPFFCVHGYNAYRHIAGQLGANWPFYGLGLHFTGRRVTRTRVEDQAKGHLKEIYAIQPRGPYYIAGHSIGGLIAYELAQLLQNDGHEVAFLGLIDTVFPKRANANNLSVRDGVMKCWYALARLAAANRFDQFLQTVKASAQWRLKAIQCHGYHWVNKPLPPELLTFYVDEIVFRGKYAKEQRRYQPRPFRGCVHYFRATQSLNDVEKWKLITNRQLVVHEIPGTHLTMIEETGALELARGLKLRLEEIIVGRPQASRHVSHSSGTKPLLPAMVFQRSVIRR